MTEKSINWEQDGIDPGWFFAKDIGSVRSNASYRPGGWWFLAKWLLDTEEHDIGPFKNQGCGDGRGGAPCGFAVTTEPVKL